ncbi:MAG: Hsp20/alpha crystallin family protein [Chloroflexi bacterium]|nr:Hsp20/alpha crystallin family protein [Chloroflexota bacterium]MCH8234676.1 Hsp20/alpha crystallin family protein [Chloroflexota bacterium]
MTLQRRSPFAGLRRFNDFNDRFWFPLARFRTVTNRFSRAADTGWGIPLDVVEQDGDLVVSASVPGIEPADIKVNIEDGVLTIRAQMKEETAHAESEYLRRERRTGSFFRAVQLPDTVEQEKVTSEYANGVLTVTLPKSEASKPRDIEVKVA